MQTYEAITYLQLFVLDRIFVYIRKRAECSHLELQIGLNNYTNSRWTQTFLNKFFQYQSIWNLTENECQ